MNIIEIIDRKGRAESLDAEQIDAFVQGYMNGTVADYQAAALLMAIRIQGMDAQESAALTWALARSGDMLDLAKYPGVKVDKHSTGGVADSTTLIAAPLAAACGVPIAKMSGRGLGHTGGTVDKLESIPGVHTDLTQERFLEIFEQHHLVLAGQSLKLAPADGKLYALRDVTGTVESLPLIASSIMSKKLAAGCDAILLDIKCGNGAFLTSHQQALDLAQSMVEIGEAAGKCTAALLSDMSQPLGHAIGNKLEVAEALEILAGFHIDGRLARMSMELAACMVTLSGIASIEQARILVNQALHNGGALRKLRQVLLALGAQEEYIMDARKLYCAKICQDVPSQVSGYVSAMDVKELGRAAQMLGAGRMRMDDVIDYDTGVWMHVELGQEVHVGETLCKIYANDSRNLQQVQQRILDAIEISPQPPAEVPPLIYKRVNI